MRISVGPPTECNENDTRVIRQGGYRDLAAYRLWTMPQLLPKYVADIDVEATYFSDVRTALPHRPWVVVNTATTLDGATAIDGKSGGIGGNADRLAFHALRAACDLIVAGAGTVRAEHYGPPAIRPHLIEQRLARGRPAHPRLAIVTRSLDLDLETPLFTDTPTRPLIITTTSSGAVNRPELTAVADVLEAGDHDVDMASALASLGSMGLEVVLVEGGPSLNGQLVTGDLVDEWCLTLGSRLVAGQSSRAAVSHQSGVHTRFSLTRAIVSADDLLLRYELTDRAT